MSSVYEVLRQAFRGSSYLHSVGTGDEQGVQRVVDATEELMATINDDVSPNPLAQAFIAGAIMSRALCDLHTALDAAEELIIEFEEEDN